MDTVTLWALPSGPVWTFADAGSGSGLEPEFAWRRRSDRSVEQELGDAAQPFPHMPLSEPSALYMTMRPAKPGFGGLGHQDEPVRPDPEMAVRDLHGERHRIGTDSVHRSTYT
jgi:hypothetical protein